MEAKLGGTALSQCRSVDYRERRLPLGSKSLLKEKEQPAPQGRREVRIPALFTPATDGVRQALLGSRGCRRCSSATTDEHRRTRINHYASIRSTKARRQ